MCVVFGGDVVIVIGLGSLLLVRVFRYGLGMVMSMFVLVIGHSVDLFFGGCGFIFFFDTIADSSIGYEESLEMSFFTYFFDDWDLLCIVIVVLFVYVGVCLI